MGASPPPRDGAIIYPLLLSGRCRLSTSFSRVGFRPVVFSILNKFRLRTRSFCPLYADPTARSHQALHLCCRQTGPADAPGLLPDGALVWLLGLHLSPCGRWGLHLTGALLPPACGCPSPILPSYSAVHPFRAFRVAYLYRS